MKRLDLIIPQERFHEVNELLRKHKVGGLTSFDINGRGRTKNEPHAIAKGTMRYIPEFESRTKIEVLVPDSLIKSIIDDVLKLISTGSASYDKIFVYVAGMLRKLTILEANRPEIMQYKNEATLKVSREIKMV